MVLCLAKPICGFWVAELQRECSHAPDVKHVRLTALSHVLEATINLFRYFYRLGRSPLRCLGPEAVERSWHVGCAGCGLGKPSGRLGMPGAWRQGGRAGQIEHVC